MKKHHKVVWRDSYPLYEKLVEQDLMAFAEMLCEDALSPAEREFERTVLSNPEEYPTLYPQVVGRRKMRLLGRVKA
ncbi:hypothetical protein GOV11_00895 [Candidatus Woesearchaeota archaeon]|nr:hypothetical protein [Candidatus Woesearchaeota archaeon]